MELPEYRHPGARALVLLHEQHLREFVVTWNRARAASVLLPATSDPNYVSLDTLLHHVLRAARGYMVWMCRNLQLPDPDIDPTPAAADIEAMADTYLEHVCQRWRAPLAEVPAERFEAEDYPSNWKNLYCIDAMLEHAVMHPIRHGFQLRNLMNTA